MSNSKDAFFAAASIKRDTVTVDGFGELELHGVRLCDYLDITSKLKGEKQEAYITGIILGCDLFDDDDAGKLRDVEPSILLKLFNRVMQLSGMAKDDAKKP